MPIFAVSSLGRGVANILQRARVERDEDDDSRGLSGLRGRLQARLAAAEESGRGREAAPAASRQELLATTQQGEDVAQTLVAERRGRSPNIGGVGTVRAEDDTAQARPGNVQELQQQPSVFQSRSAQSAASVRTTATATLGGGLRFASNAVANRAPQAVAAGSPTDLIADLGNDLVPPLDAETDARIRLLAANRQAAATAPAERASAETAPVAAEPQAFPSAEEISRANTTPEIRQNVRADTGEIGQGLQADAVADAAQNARRTAASAQAAQRSAADVVSNEGRQDLQELRSEVRDLDRARSETQREIQDLENEIRQAESGGAPSATAAAALATQVEALTV